MVVSVFGQNMYHCFLYHVAMFVELREIVLRCVALISCVTLFVLSRNFISLLVAVAVMYAALRVA